MNWILGPALCVSGFGTTAFALAWIMTIKRGMFAAYCADIAIGTVLVVSGMLTLLLGLLAILQPLVGDG